MSSNPSTYKGDPGEAGGPDWDHSAELHKREDSGGVMYHFRTIRRGTVAELVDFVMDLPEAEQRDYSIQKAGDRRLEIGDIRNLFNRPDFPHGRAG